MAKHNLLDTDTVNLNDVFANGKKYRVPVYQRDYSWQEENWDDLWADILAIKSHNSEHYMGAIVLQDHKNKTYSIIDGQQRLATLSLVALAVIKRIQDLIESGTEPEANQERKELLVNNYIGAKDAVSLTYSNKLALNENNDSFYRAYPLQLRHPINLHRESDSNRLLWKAFSFFYDRVNEHFGAQVSGEELADFMLNQVAERLLFIQIVVEDELNAYTVFETLNARGLELTTTDLLKNYLLALSSASPADQLLAKEKWQRIIQTTDLDAFPQFLRYYWNSRNEAVRKDNLFKALRQTVKSREESFALLDALLHSAGVYAALENPHDELWAGVRGIRRHVQELNLFGVTLCYPLLLVAYANLPITEFERVLRICAVISFRYNVIAGQNPKVQERAYNIVACKIHSGAITNAAQVAQSLQLIYLSDEDFVNAFSTKAISTKRGKKLVRYILYALENQMAGTDRNFEDESGTIEHILPENPSNDWEQFFSVDEQLDYIYRLGNYTLLEQSKNSVECRNRLYAEKLAVYKTSQFQMTNSIDYPEWTPAQVKSRQMKLAKIAKSVWKI